MISHCHHLVAYNSSMPQCCHLTSSYCMFQQMASSCHLGNLKQLKILLKHPVNMNQNWPFLMHDSSMHVFPRKKGKKEKKITRKKITSLLFFKSFHWNKKPTIFYNFFYHFSTIFCDLWNQVPACFFPTLNFLFYSNTSCKIKFLSVWSNND